MNAINIIKSVVTKIDITHLSKTDINSKVSAIVLIGGVPVPTSFGADTAFEKNPFG